jgi:3-hydroxyacyl-[acyl-carrier-protein] dehydratase
MRYFLIDQVTELVVGERARGVKCVTLTDEVLHDHFPDYPTLPGALILEGASQLAGFLLEMTLNRTDQPLRRALLTQIELAKFHERVRPGDRLEIRATIQNIRDPSAQTLIEASIGEKRAARALLTFRLQTVDSDRLHQQRRDLYRQWTRNLELPIPIL